jgi:STE24 endopeptidase
VDDPFLPVLYRSPEFCSFRLHTCLAARSVTTTRGAILTNQSRSKQYSRIKERLALTSTAVGLAGGVLFVTTGMARALNDKLLRRRPTRLDRVRYQTTLALGSWVAGLPLAFYSSYVIEKRFGLSNQTRSGWAADQVKAETMSLPVQIALVEGMQWTMRRWPRHWWLIVSGAAIPLTSLLMFIFPVLIAPRFNRYEPLKDPALSTRLSDLAERSHLNVAEIMQMDMSRRTSKANAFFAGIGTSKRIVVSDTMLTTFTHDEIETVVAHEAGHQVNRDLWRNIAATSILTLAVARATDFAGGRILSARPEMVGTSDLGDPRAIAVIGIAFGVAGTLLTPIQLAHSRWIERRADRFALDLTHNGDAYASALEKLAEANLADPDPPRWVTVLLHSHPPISERVAAARSHSASGGSTG